MTDRITNRSERLFLAGCAKERVQANFRSTVLNPVEESRYLSFTDTSVTGERPIWGVEDGTILRSTWEQVRPGDWILFYTGKNPITVSRSGMLEYAAKVVTTEENPELQSQLWDEYEGSGGSNDKHRGPWPLILYLESPINIEVHHDELREIADFSEKWNPQRFSTYSGETNIRRQHGSISDFVEARKV